MVIQNTLSAAEESVKGYCFIANINGKNFIMVSELEDGSDLPLSARKTGYVFTEVAPLKYCKICKEDKPSTEFKTDNRNKDGKEGTCKKCKELDS